MRPILAASTTLDAFLAQAGTLTPAERLLLVEQAIVMLESFYVHLPLKRAMHAVDPLQRLRLLRKRLASIGSDARFHAELTSIFNSLRDLHTNYLLPAPLNSVVARLPFRVDECTDNGRRSYIVGGVATNFQHPTFKEGVELLYWNGIPIDRAVEIAADRHAGSNMAARHSRGLAGLTQRPLIIAPPPDDQWVIIGYKELDGTIHDIRLDWQVTGLPPSSANADADTSAAIFALGLDLETELIQQARRILFAPHTETARAKIAAAGADPLSAVGGTESIMPNVLTAREVTTSHGKFGHIRIRTFGVPNNDADAFVNEFIRLAELLPQNGLMVYVPDNGGGLTYAGAPLLQTMPPRTLLALALGSPAPAAVHPGPSAGVLLPIAGIEGRPVGGLHNVLPGLPDVLTPIPRPMTGVPSVAGQGRWYVFRQCCRRWRCHDSVGRWHRRQIIDLREQSLDFGEVNHRNDWDSYRCGD